MFGRRINLFKLFGFEVRLDLSWILMAILVTWSLAKGLFPATAPRLPESTYWIMGVVGTIGLFASIVIHEFFHALVARLRGMKMNGITLFIFGGVAELGDEPPDAKTEFLVAIAGPIASVGLAGLLWLTQALLGDVAPTSVLAVFGYLAAINLVLAVFNMVPAFPLDGGRILRSAIWHFGGSLRKATRIASGIGSLFGMLLVVLGVVAFVTGNIFTGIWWFMLGMFLQAAAAGSYQQVLLKQALSGVKVENVMKAAPVAVPASTNIRDFVENYVFRYPLDIFAVEDRDAIVGVIANDQVRELPREQWEWTTVGSLAKPLSPENTVSTKTDVMKAMAKMNQTPASALLVMDGERLNGILTMADISRFFAVRSEFAEEPTAAEDVEPPRQPLDRAA